MVASVSFKNLTGSSMKNYGIIIMMMIIEIENNTAAFI
jgi:hypothetical protein